MILTLQTMKHHLEVVLCCLSVVQGLICRPSTNEIRMNISKVDKLAHILSDKVLLVAQKYIERDPLVSMFFPFEEGDNLMFELMVKTNQKMNSFWTLLTNDNILSKSEYDDIYPTTQWNKPDVYILPLHKKDEFDRFDSQLEQLIRHNNFNPKAKFVLLKLTNECGRYDKPNIWVRYFSKLWEQNCLLTVVLVLSTCDFNLTLVKADPYSSKNPCRTPNVQGINSFTFSQEIENIDFMKESQKYFNGCNFVATTQINSPYTILLHQPRTTEDVLNYAGGLEVKLLRILSKKLRFTYELDKSNHLLSVGCIYYANVTTEQRRRHKFDFCFCGMTPISKSVFIYDISLPYMFSELSWFVADAIVAPQWKIVFEVCSSGVWILIVFVNFTFTLLYNILEEYEFNGSKKSSERSLDRKHKSYLELLRTFLGFPSTLKPQKPHLKVLYVAWFLFSMHMNITLSTTLYKRLRNPPFEKEINTIKELHYSGFKYAGQSKYFQLFQGSNIDNMTRYVLGNRVIFNASMDQCFEKLSNYRNFSILDRYECVRYLIDMKKLKIHKINENMIVYGSSILMKKGNPLTMEMNKVIMQAFESGFAKIWEKDASRSLRKKRFTLEIPKEENKSPLSMNSLQSAFLLLIYGCTTSFTVFIIEIILHSFKLKQ